MLEIQNLRAKKEEVISGLIKRNITDANQLVEDILQLDDKRKALQQKNDDEDLHFEFRSCFSLCCRQSE